VPEAQCWVEWEKIAESRRTAQFRNSFFSAGWDAIIETEPLGGGTIINARDLYAAEALD
jgi:hypothetical protein